MIVFYLLQLSSSELSEHSGVPLQCKCPGMQWPELHLNWSGLQVPTMQLGASSSEPSGQSLSPSHNHAWWMQLIRSMHSNSRVLQCEWCGFGVGNPVQFCLLDRNKFFFSVFGSRNFDLDQLASNVFQCKIR